MKLLKVVISFIALVSLQIAAAQWLHVPPPVEARGLMMVGGGVPVAAAANGVIGTTTESTTSTLYSGVAYHTKFTTTTAGTVRYAHIRVSDGNARTICLSLWSVAGVKLLSGSAVASDGTSEWINIDLGSTVDIVAATDYYLGIQVSDSFVCYRDTSGGSIFQFDVAYSCTTDITPESDLLSNVTKITMIINNSSGSPT